MARLAGMVDEPVIDLPWHVHEMIFGFMAAIIAGFALTAVRNWTSRKTPTGLPLALLLGLWLLGRAAMLCTPSWLTAVLDLALLPAIALAVLRPILAAGQRRNLFLPAALLVLGLCNLAFHASRLGWLVAAPMTSLVAALYLVVLLECLIAGRVIPGFTGNVIGRSLPRGDVLDRATIGVTAGALGAAVLFPQGAATAALALTAGLLHFARLARWQPWATWRVPILWILHLAYGWIPVGFVFVALSALGLAPPSAALHAFGVGATGGLIAAMTTRSARGHTARELRAGAAEIAMYLLIQVAALARLWAVFGTEAWYLLVLGAMAWSCAFALFLLRYAPWLLRPRLDGQRG
jgi:uncharacterized protein involved in response to NO